VYLLHNTLTNGVIKVNSTQLKSYVDCISSTKTFSYDPQDEFQSVLKSLGMIVDEKEDELASLNSLYFSFEHNSELYVMLIVTRRCNFRCAYCYEEYIDSDMDQSIFNTTKNFIISQIQQENFNNVYLSFFGGEPTLMAKEINAFMKELLAENEALSKPAAIKAIMTTNGFLLTPELIDEFISNRIIRYQITVDGMEAEHDSSRYLAGKKGTWKKIIDNLNYFKKVKNEDVSVLIRSNISPNVYSNIDHWLEYLHENFNDHKRFRMHFEIAKNFGKMNDQTFAVINNEIEVILDIIERSKKWRLPLELVGFRTMPFSLVCYAARQFSYIVDYNGEIKKCTSSSLDEPYNLVGELGTKGLTLDFKKAAQWTSYGLSEKCKSCEILALCYRRKCPVSKDSFKNCDYLKQSYYKGLEYSYLAN
jgi:uncharacterized protein